jgi:hypothetical protein
MGQLYLFELLMTLLLGQSLSLLHFSRGTVPNETRADAIAIPV